MTQVTLDWDNTSGAYGDGESWADREKKWPSSLNKYVGKTYFHPGRGHLYEVMGVTYQSEDDRWMIAYQRVTRGGLKTGPLYNHRPEDFLREGRFMEVKK